MAIAEKFDYDANTLHHVKEEIDPPTTASCARDREVMLGILQLPSLSETVQ